MCARLSDFLRISESDYRNAAAGVLPSNEMQIYTWKDANLREIFNLMKDVIPCAAHPNANLVFSLVYPDKDGNHVIKQVSYMTHLKRSCFLYIIATYFVASGWTSIR